MSGRINPLLIWSPVALLVCLAGIVGYRWGVAEASLNESDVINRSARVYLAQAGEEGALTDCVAYPGEDPRVWIVIRCGTAGAEPTLFFAGPRGELLRRVGPDLGTNA